MKRDLLRLISERLIPSDSLPILSKLENLENINWSKEIEEPRFPKVGLVGCSTWFGPDAGVTHRVGYSWVTPELSQGVLLPSITCICNRISITILAFVSLWGWGNPCQ